MSPVSAGVVESIYEAPTELASMLEGGGVNCKYGYPYSILMRAATKGAGCLPRPAPIAIHIGT